MLGGFALLHTIFEGSKAYPYMPSPQDGSEIIRSPKVAALEKVLKLCVGLGTLLLGGIEGSFLSNLMITKGLTSRPSRNTPACTT